MIKEFWVENFLSIKERQTLSFVTSKREADDTLATEIKPNLYLNKLAIFYGANASGKSNILLALDTIFKLLFSPAKNKDSEIGTYQPFALTDKEPTTMSISFFKDKIQYNYVIKYCRNNIIYEKLVFYPNGVPALFYERTFVNKNIRPDIKFGEIGLLTESKNTLISNTFNNHSVLSTCNKITLKEDARQVIDLYEWINNYVHNINGDKEDSIKDIIKGVNKDIRKKQFFIQMLHKADFNIKDFSIVQKEKKIASETLEEIKKTNISEDIKKELLNPIEEVSTFINHSKDGDFPIPSNLQSRGTIKYMKLLNILYDLISGGHTYIMDELDVSLHEDLLSYYLLVFLFNSDDSQLVFSTQNSSLLDEDFITRDMIWICEKSKDTAASEYNKVTSFKLHKNLSLYKSFKNGKLGGRPDLGSPYLNMGGDL